MDSENNGGRNIEEEKCRLCLYFSPKWARRLGTRRVFTFVYSLQNIVQGLSFTYIASAITTIESHFQLPSESFGLAMSLGEVVCLLSAVVSGLIIGAKTDRPRAMGISLLILGIGTHLMALPYYIYGSPTPLNSTINGTSTYSLCTQNADEKCVTSLLAPSGSTKWSIVLIFGMAWGLANIGGTALYIVGTPFVDDNVQNKNSPMYIALLTSIRTLGPILGFVLSSGCLALYVNPSVSPGFDDHDLRWVGAWWLGFVVISILSILCGFLLAQFPQRLPSKRITPAAKMALEEMKPADETINGEMQVNDKSTIPPLKEIIPAIRRLVVNGKLWTRTFSECLTLLAIEGFIIYLPKYLEHEFNITASDASLLTGSVLLVPTLFGNFIVGYLVKRFQPSTGSLAGILCASKVIQAITMTSLVALRCDDTSILGSGSSKPVCESSVCDCSKAIFSPICGVDGETYFSACHAGCSLTAIVGENTFFSNCSCIINGGTAVPNACETTCPQKTSYLILVAFSKLCLSVHVIAGILFLLRCVEPRDKTIASGFLGTFLGILTFIPGPVVFSAIVDSTCKVWGEQCGRTGACNVYDMEALSTCLHTIPGALLFGAAVWDFWFWCLGRNKMKLFEDDENVTTNDVSNNTKCNSKTT